VACPYLGAVSDIALHPRLRRCPRLGCLIQSRCPIWAKRVCTWELQENWTQEQDAQRKDMSRESRIRMTQLADQLEREPEYRRGITHIRVSIAKTLLEPMLQSNEGGYMTTLILQESSRLVRDDAQAEYAELPDQAVGRILKAESMMRRWAPAAIRANCCMPASYLLSSSPVLRGVH
jgi:hypothetical protein